MPRTVQIISENPLFRRAMAEALAQVQAVSAIIVDTDTARVPPGMSAVTIGAQGQLRPPFRLAELAQAASAKADTSLPGGWRLNSSLRLLHKGGASLALTEKEAALLAALAPGEAVSREELLADIWGYGESIDTHTLETHIHRLRAKLKEIGGEDWIETAGAGYRLQS